MTSFGAHVDAADPVGKAQALGVELAQLFLGNPQGWKGPEVVYPGGATALRQAAQAAGIGLYVHAPYVLNVASLNNRVRVPSRQQLQKQLTTAAEIGARGLVVHGGHVADEADLERGFDNWRKCVEGLDIAVPLLIENTAGGTGAMARGLDRIARLWDAVQSASSGAEQVGFCLDTCHAHASGEELAGLASRLRQVTGRIDLVHANDSRDELGSGADRHADLGTGHCDPDGLVSVIVESEAPVVFETPAAKQGRSDDLRWLASRLA